MNSNDLQNISKIYQEQVSTQLDELSADLVLRASKEASKRAAVLSALGSDVPKAVKKAKKFRRQAERFYDYQAKKRRQDSVSEGKKPKPDYLDFDDDGDEQEPMKKALRDRNKKSVKEALIGRQSQIDVNKNNKIDAQDFKILRSSKNKKIKEGFSNWREDLIEVTSKLESKDGKEPKVVEKEVNNTVKINPNLDLGEAIEELGGTLLEMNEIEDFEGVLDDLSESEIFLLSDQLIEEVVEEFFYECIEEGYDILEVENQLLESLEISSSILNEAEVTLGHDTKIKSGKLEKVKSAVKKVGKGIAHGTGYVAGLAVRGAKAVGRELGSGYKRGRHGASGSSSSSSGSSSGSGSSSSSSGSSSGSGSSRPGLLGRIGSKLMRGLARVAKSVSRRSRNFARRLEQGSSSGSGSSVSSSRSSTQYPKVLERRPGHGDPEAAKRQRDEYRSKLERSGSPTDPNKGRSGSSGSSSASGSSSTTQSSTSQRQRSRVTQGRGVETPSSVHSKSGARTARPRSGIGGGKRVEVAGEPKKQQPVQKVSASDVTPKKTKAPVGTSENPRIGQPGPDKPKATTRTVSTRRFGSSSSFTPRGEQKYQELKAKIKSEKKGKSKKAQSKSADDQDDTNGKLDDLLKSIKKESYQISEKAESEQQQKLFGLALSVKRGKTPRSEVSAEVLKIVDTMSEKKIRDFAKTSHEGLPKKVQTKEEAIREQLLYRMITKIEEQGIEQANSPDSSTTSQVFQAQQKAASAKKDLATKLKTAATKGVDVSLVSL